MGLDMECKNTEFSRKEDKYMYFLRKSFEKLMKGVWNSCSLEGWFCRRHEDDDEEEQKFVISMNDRTGDDLIRLQNEMIDKNIVKTAPQIVKKTN